MSTTDFAVQARRLRDELRRIWDALIPNTAAVLVNGSAFVILVGFILIFWQFLQPGPIRSVEIVSVKPEDRTISRDYSDFMVLVRRVCASRPANVRVIREWIDAAGGRIPLVDDWAAVAEGCHERAPVHVYPPPSVKPGVYTYNVTLHACNSLQCWEYHVPGVQISVVGTAPTPAPQVPTTNHF